MRKLIGFIAAIAALAGAGMALAGQGATNKSGQFIDLNVAVTPPISGTAKAPRGVGVSFDSFTGNRINGNTVGGGSGILVRFNKGFKENGLLFPSCKINSKALSVCSKASQIGTGTAEAYTAGTNGAPPTFIPAKLVAYNGKPLSGKTPTLIFIALLGGKPTVELDFTAKQQPSGPYGLAFKDIVFPGSVASALGISKFSVKIPDRTVPHRVNGKTVRVHLIEAPTTCHGSWQFSQTNTLGNGSTLTATDSQPCVKG